MNHRILAQRYCFTFASTYPYFIHILEIRNEILKEKSKIKSHESLTRLRNVIVVEIYYWRGNLCFYFLAWREQNFRNFSFSSSYRWFVPRQATVVQPSLLFNCSSSDSNSDPFSLAEALWFPPFILKKKNVNQTLNTRDESLHSGMINCRTVASFQQSPI